MCDQWMPLIDLPISWQQFWQLPRNAAYKYEYFDQKAQLTPRPRHYHAILELDALDVADSIAVAPLRADELDKVLHLFSAAFQFIQPYGSLDDETRLEAARHALERVRTGGDGPWIEQASFIALEGEDPIGAILITLLPDGDPCDWDSYHWREPPPANCIQERLGRPHLTWIFVSPWHAGHGVGTGMLAASVRELRRMGFTELLSTFMLGNESSMLWHWRNGFQLLSYPGSYRLMKERWKRQKQ